MHGNEFGLYVFPVITAGLHCGIERIEHNITPGSVFPVITAGLHCGQGRWEQG